MTRKNLPIAFYLLLVFVSGSVVGALGYRTYNPPTARSVSAPQRPSPSEAKRQYLDESRSRLGLTDDQVEKLSVILDQTNVRFREVRERENEKIRQIGEEHYQRVRTMLTPEQLPKYEKLHEERQAKAKQQEQQNKR
jgi:hypothetical protein